MRKMIENANEIDSLLKKVSSGDEEAFSELARIFSPQLNKIISSLGIPQSETDDAKQEGLIGLVRAAGAFDPELSSFSTFAYICMKTSILSFLRKGVRGKEIPFSDEAFSKTVSPAPDPETKVIGDEEKSAVLKKMEKSLSGFEMEVLLLYAAGDDVPSISEKLGKSRKSVENALFRSRKKIRDLI